MSDKFEDDKDNQEQFNNSFQSIDTHEDKEEDSLTVYREVFSKTEDERFNEEITPNKQALLSNAIITNPHIDPYTTDWTLNNVLCQFRIGNLVILSNKEVIYKVVDFGAEINTYIVRQSNTDFNITVKGSILKEAPKNSVWEKYISDPYQKWLNQQEDKKKASNTAKK
jgi:type III secretory pathway component EscR